MLKLECSSRKVKLQKRQKQLKQQLWVIQECNHLARSNFNHNAMGKRTTVNVFIFSICRSKQVNKLVYVQHIHCASDATQVHSQSSSVWLYRYSLDQGGSHLFLAILSKAFMNCCSMRVSLISDSSMSAYSATCKTNPANDARNIFVNACFASSNSAWLCGFV